MNIKVNNKNEEKTNRIFNHFQRELQKPGTSDILIVMITVVGSDCSSSYYFYF